MGRVDEYIARARQLGIHHLAVTDHGVMYAAMEWFKAATKAGLHPIVGIEAYLAEGSAAARERKSYHLLLLAENETGYRKDRKSTRLNSSHANISYAVFCLKKKKIKLTNTYKITT